MGMKKDTRWKGELEQYKTDLACLRKALDYAAKPESDEEFKFLVLRGVAQAFGVAVQRSGSVMNEYMASLGQARNRTLRSIFTKALKMGLLQHKRWLEAEADMMAICQLEEMEQVLKLEKKIRRVYLPLLTRFAEDMTLKCQPTLF